MCQRAQACADQIPSINVVAQQDSDDQQRHDRKHARRRGDEWGCPRSKHVARSPPLGGGGRIRVMLKRRRPWQEELAIIDRTMKAISGVTDPEELVNAYYGGIGELIAI